LQNDPPNEFYEPFLKFRITKPDAWEFTEPRWSPMVQLRNGATAAHEWLRWAAEPFVCAMKPHDSDGQAYPTLQVSARMTNGLPPPQMRRDLLEEQLILLRATFREFELLESTTDRIVAGFRANAIRATAVHTTDRDFQILTRLFTLFTPTVAFTIGMSSSADPRYYDEAEFDAMLESVRIGE
jgi:hypothetical protein